MIPRRFPNRAESPIEVKPKVIVLSYRNALIERGIREGDKVHIVGKIVTATEFDFGTVMPAVYISVQRASKLREH